MVLVRGDLQFTVTAPNGSTSGTVTGDGATVAVHAEDPAAAWDAVVGAGGGAGVRRSAAGLLYDEGVRVEVSGPQGRVASVGAGVDSTVGALLAGSRHIRLGSPAAVRPLALGELRRVVAQGRRAVSGPRPVASLATAGLLAWAVLRAARRR